MKLTVIGIASLVLFVLGFLVGFIPEHIAKAHVEQRAVDLATQGQATQTSLHHTERQLQLSEFALEAAVVSADANSNNYSDASADASALFTGLRNFVDHGSGDPSKRQIEDVLLLRDATIAGLAKADAGVRPVLTQIFAKLQIVSSQAKS